ncbi:MAG: cupin-like domain-containing protein, partial [Bradymonadaceae bacterium]
LAQELEGARRLLPNYGFWIAFLWFGGDQCKTPLHHDHSPNIFVQVQGEKRFILHPPYEQENLYQCTEEHENLFDSCVNAFDPDLTKFPRYEEAESWEAIVRSGDVLFLPSGWWHAVQSLTTSISVNHWWLAPTKVAQSAVRKLAPDPLLDSRSNCWMCAKQQT